MSESHSVTDFLADRGRSAGDEQTDRLVRQIAEELRKIARARVSQGQADMDVEDFVQEAFRRLVLESGREYADRKHFYRSAARAIRNLRIDSARRRRAAQLDSRLVKSDPGQPDPEAGLVHSEKLLRLHGALVRLEENDPEAAELLELLYFGVREPVAPGTGEKEDRPAPSAPLSVEEVGNLLGISRATAYRVHRRGLAWLRAHLGDEEKEARS